MPHSEIEPATVLWLAFRSEDLPTGLLCVYNPCIRSLTKKIKIKIPVPNKPYGFFWTLSTMFTYLLCSFFFKKKKKKKKHALIICVLENIKGCRMFGIYLN